MTDENQQITLRDSIANAIETVEANPTPTENVPQGTSETEEQREQRARDEQGRFAKHDKTDVKVESKTEQKASPKPIQRPSSWKKDYWPHWDKMASGQTLAPEEARQIAEYSAQRESDFAKGVSTYKAEWDRAKPYLEAMTPIQPLLEQRGMTPEQFLQTSRQTFQTLTSGSPQQKIGLIFQLAQDYQVPLEQIFERSEDGRFYLNPQAFNQLSVQTQAQQPPIDIDAKIEEKLMQREATRQVEEIKSQSEKFPYLEQVRETMAGLLRSGLVEDLSSAYQTALHMPKHADLLEESNRLQREAQEQAEREKAVQKVNQARAKAVSPRSSTPAKTDEASKGKGLRSQIADAFDQVNGRV